MNTERNCEPLFLVVGEGGEDDLMVGSHATETMLMGQDRGSKKLIINGKDLTADVSVVSNNRLTLPKSQQDDSRFQTSQRSPIKINDIGGTELDMEGAPTSPNAARRVGSSCINKRRSSLHMN